MKDLVYLNRRKVRHKSNYYFEPKSGFEISGPVLKVNIIIGKDLPNVSGEFVPAHGLMGIIKIEKKYFLIVVTDVEVVGTIKGSQIYRYESITHI